ncbi:HK97 gp10 family phage protein [Clostridium estertheticum]|uniref:HK97 gp10 family phage protein n=1 Tax=Clostridium estertheticum TaxID=238834 RepID=UPI001C6DD5E3|nr:HK97 gp10 family phage protein [Clostridium estertheticum]MBW9170776.1 HK97 gp10 family phage protein [Clostridium estertheticum]WLC74385.1 HK97 gp10 family phage protein [Clostridium estertheticum]
MGFDISNLTEFEKDLLKLANDTMKKESTKFLKKSATKLSKEQKKEIKTINTGLNDEQKKLLLSKTKAGKVYKYEGKLSCRAFSGAVIKGKNENFYSLSGMINNGYVHRGGKNKDGKETFIEGQHFMESAQYIFEGTYYEEVQKFIDDMLDKGLN